MKWTQVAIFTIVAAVVSGCAGPKIPVGLEANNPIDVSQALDVYAQLTGKTVETEPGVRNDQTLIFLHQTQPLTRTQAGNLIERDLREQAGIIILTEHRKHVVFGFQPNARSPTVKP